MKWLPIAALSILAAVTGCASPSSTVAGAGPTFAYQGQTAGRAAAGPVAQSAANLVTSGSTVAIRSSGERSWWYVRTGVSFNPDAPDARGPDVVFAASSGPDRFFVEKVAQGSSVGITIESGDFVRLRDIEHDGWLEANIDNPLFVVSDSRLHDDTNARFLIEKTTDRTAGSADRRIRMGDAFRLRGIHGEPWLVSPIDGVVTVSSDQAMASQFEFAAPPQR
jgi:hypothetical protein